MIYKKYDIVVVPFPFVDSPLSKPRPAVVLSDENFQKRNHHIHLGMVTTSKNTHWKDDVFLSEKEKTGLSCDSYFRPKIFTLHEDIIKRKIGEVCEKDHQKIHF